MSVHALGGATTFSLCSDSNSVYFPTGLLGTIWHNLEQLIPHLWYTDNRASQLHRQLRGRGAAGVHRLGGDSPGAHQRRAGADLPKADRRDPEPHAAGPRRAPAPGEGGLARGHQERVPHGSRLLHLAGDAASRGSYYYAKHSS